MFHPAATANSLLRHRTNGKHLIVLSAGRVFTRSVDHWTRHFATSCKIHSWVSQRLAMAWQHLGRSERLAAAANFPVLERDTETNHPSMYSAVASCCGRKVDHISRAHNLIGIKLMQR
jgi:hypothetical protein